MAYTIKQIVNILLHYLSVVTGGVQKRLMISMPAVRGCRLTCRARDLLAGEFRAKFRRACSVKR